MTSKKILKRLLGIILAICVVCTGSLVDFGPKTAKAEDTATTVSHDIPENVSRYKVSYTGQQKTMLYNEIPVNWTDSTTIYLTYRVVSYTAGTHLQGYCGTSTVDGYPFNDNTGMMTRTNTLMSTGEESKTEVLKVGYTYFVAFDVTNSGMTVRAERVKDGVTETVSYDKMHATPNGVSAVDCSLMKYFGLYLGETAYTAALSDVSIYDANGNDLGVTGYGLAEGALQQLPGRVNHEIPKNVSQYKVSYTGQIRTMIYNATTVDWTDSTTIYLTYKVDSYTAGTHLQGYCGTSTVDGYPFNDNTGMMTRTNTLMSTGEESKTEVLKPGYTYYVAFDVTNSGMTVRADRVKDGVTETVSYDKMHATPDGVSAVDCSLMKYFGLYLGETAYTAALSDVSIYDANGNDLGVTGYGLAEGALLRLPGHVEQEIPKDVSRYKVNYTGQTCTMIYNEEEINWTGSTTVYLTYRVESYTSGGHLQGYCGTSVVDSWPYNDNTGLMTRSSNLSAPTEVLKEGYTYFIAFDISNSGMTVRADRVKDGVTERVPYDKFQATPDGESAIDYSLVKYFGLFLGDSPHTATLTDVSIYDADGHDLGVKGNNLASGALKQLPRRAEQEIPANVSRYQVEYTGQHLTMLCNSTPVEWSESKTVYLTYKVVSYTAGVALQGYCGTNTLDAYPYDLGTGLMTRNETLLSAGQESMTEVLKPGYTYYVAFDVTNEGMTVRADRVKDGVTESVHFDKIWGTNEGTDPVNCSTLDYFGLYLGGSSGAGYTANLTDVSIYDADGNDYGLQCPRFAILNGGTITQLPPRMRFESVGEETSFKDGTLSLHLVPTTTVSGISNQTTYKGLSVKIDDGPTQPITVKKTSYGTIAFELTGLDKSNFTLTIPAGVANATGTTDGKIELLEDTTIYVNEYAVTMEPMAGVGVTATVVTDGTSGFYFTTSSADDTLEVGGTGQSANIYNYKGNDNGIFVNGEKTEAYLRKVESGRYRVCLAEAGYSVAAGDAITVSGCFQYGDTLIAFEPFTAKYTEGAWSEMTSGTIPMTESIVDGDSDVDATYLVEGNSVEVIYPNTTQATKVADNTVLYAVGDYTVSRTMGTVTFQKQVVIYRTGDVNADGALNVIDLVALKKENVTSSAGQYAVQTLVGIGDTADKGATLRTKLVYLDITKSGEVLPNIVGTTGAGTYAADYISSVDATENGTTVFSVTDGSDTSYKTKTDYDNYGLDYVLDFNFDRDIKVLQLTDTQIIDSTQMRYADRLYQSSIDKYQPENMENLVFSYMRETIQAAQPDLILLTGDNIYGEFDDQGTSLQTLIAELDSYQIPWAPIFGNHDNESAMGVEWQCEQLMKSEYCLFNRRHSIGGNGNYSIGLSKEGELQRVIYMMDSNFCFAAPKEEYTNGNLITKQGFTDAQIAWYRSLQLRVNQVAGETIPSFLCCHLPDRGVLEGAIWAGYQSGEDSSESVYTIGADVTAQPGDSGYKGGAFGNCLDTAMLPYMNEVGTDGIFFGHQHNINTSIYYSGVRFTFGLKTGAYDSHPDNLGGTLITLRNNAQSGERFVVEQIVAN